MEFQQQKLLNPDALEFSPCVSSSLISISTTPSPSPSYANAFPNHLPQATHYTHYYYQHQLPPPPPPQYSYFYYQQAPPVTINYHQYNQLFVSTLPVPSSAQPYNLPKSHDINLPLADEDLGLITSPTSPSPFSAPTPQILPFFRRKSRGSGRQSRFPTAAAGNNSKNTSRLVWVKKNTPLPLPLPLSSYPFGDFTSLMIRNIPVRLGRRELMKMLDDHCRQENENDNDKEPRSAFDFLYLPVDFTRKGNLGYAFVNFTTWQGASRLYNSWRETKWVNCETKKICFIDAAKYQGEVLKRHFEGSRFKCETDEYLPVKFKPARDGTNADVTELITIGTRLSN